MSEYIKLYPFLIFFSINKSVILFSSNFSISLKIGLAPYSFLSDIFFNTSSVRVSDSKYPYQGNNLFSSVYYSLHLFVI